MAELVEQRARIIDAEQRRLARRTLGEVHDVDDDRPHLVRVQLVLVAPSRRPRAGPLRGPREIVRQEQADVPAVLADHLEGANVGVVHR
jgi:hypothetical protein